MSNKEFRITQMQEYFCKKVLNQSNINVDFISSNPGDYSINRTPVEPIVEDWIIPITKKREVYSFVSRKTYGPVLAENLENIGFFEQLEEKIKSNNKLRILPDIPGIESIECLDAGSLHSNEPNSAVFSVQLQITYREEN